MAMKVSNIIKIIIEKSKGTETKVEPIKDFSEPSACTWYAKGFCQIDGAVCPFSAETYSLCPKLDWANKHPEQVRPKLKKEGDV